MQLDRAIELKTIEQLDALQTQTSPYIIYISSQDCSVCHAIYPKMMDVVNDSIPVNSIDASQTPALSGQLLVFSVPTIIMMNDHKEVYRESRFIQFEQFKSRFEGIMHG